MNRQKKYIIILLILLSGLIILAIYEYKELKADAKSDAFLASLSDEEKEYLNSLKSTNKELFINGTYPVDALYYIKDKDFKETNLALYLNYNDNYNGYLIRLVNDNILNRENADKLKKIVYDPYYLYERNNRYLNCTKQNIRSLVEYVNSDSDLKPYEEYEENDLSKGYYVQVNKHYRFKDDYEPSDLVNIDSKYGINSKLCSVAYDAFKQMADDAEKENITITITSAYRSFAKQVSLYNAYVRNDGKEKADTYSARPGFSDHQSGLTVDILSPGYDFGNFNESKAAAWLFDNAYKYGFILRYPEGKEEVTGYIYEPWHYRYVGDIAEDIKDKGITYDEYYTYYIKGN